ncbi:MAG TPA: NUDIX domain-containing protein [Candidatus Absconditabacterales bacterium]|nr:NUDIX domain-containing protein [Candidatus Absconditabacterales bacterium]
MSDTMGSFSGGRRSRTPAWLLRQQQKAIKQASTKLAEIDKTYSTKILKDDIQAETLLSDLEETKIISGITVGGIIQTTDNQIILVHHKDTGRGFPKGQQQHDENYKQTLWRGIKKEIGIEENNVRLIGEIGSYDGYSDYHQSYRHYIWYHLILNTKTVNFKSHDPFIIGVGKFDTEIILDILESPHQKELWRHIKQRLITK